MILTILDKGLIFFSRISSFGEQRDSTPSTGDIFFSKHIFKYMNGDVILEGLVELVFFKLVAGLQL